MNQVRNLAEPSIVQNALQSGEPLQLHGLVYDQATGRAENLHMSATALSG